jgi:ATP-dependent RNA helicase DDX54/DBP10
MPASDDGAKPPLKKKPQKPDTNETLDFLNEDDGDAAFIEGIL